MTIKTFADYQNEARRFVRYEPQFAPHYLFPALLLEARELSQAANGERVLEIGDAAWEIAGLLDYMGWQHVTDVDAIAIVYVNDSAIEQVADEIATIWVKAVRDNHAQLTDIKRGVVIAKLLTLLQYLAGAAQLDGTDLANVLDMNIRKLSAQQNIRKLGEQPGIEIKS